MKKQFTLQILLIVLGVLLSVPVFSQNTNTANTADLTPVVFYQSVKSCEPVNFVVEVRNPFDERDAYDFFVDGFENESVIVPKAMVLDPGESRTVSINLTPSDCTQTGRIPVVFVAQSGSDDSAVELELVLDVSPQGVPLIGSGVESILTNYSKNVAAISVANTQTQREPLKFNVRLVGESWMKIGQSSIQLGAGEEKSLNVIFEPPTTVPEREYSATIVLTDPASKKEFKKKLVVQLQTLPFAKKVLLKSIRTGSIIFLVVVLLLSLMKFYFWHNSPAQKHARLVDAELRAQHHEKKQQKLLEKQSGKQEKLIEKSLRQKYHFVAKDAVVNASGLRKPVVVFALLIMLGMVAGAVVFLRKFPNQLPFVAAGVALVVLILLLRALIHGGVKCKKFRLVVVGEEAVCDAWGKGFSQAGFVSKFPIKNLRLKIRKNRCGVPKLAECVYSYATISANVDDGFVDAVNLHAKLPLRWVKNVGDVRVWRWSGAEWLEIVPDFHRRTSKAVEIHASVDSLGTFAVGVRAPSVKSKKSEKQTAAKINGALVKKAKNTNTPGFLGYVGLAVLFVVVVVAFTYFAPKNEINAAGIPRQVWSQDSDHSLNLSLYFRDPDGDSLSFSASPVDSITVNSVGDAVLFSPSADFYGEREVIFTALDSGNNSVQSNRVKLVVVKSYLPAWVRRYMVNVVVGLVILLALFVLRRWKESLRKFLEG